MFGNMLKVAKELKAALEAGDVKVAAAKFIELQQMVYDFVFGGASVALSAADVEAKKELNTVVGEISAMAVAPGASAIGDGRLLRLIEKLLPLIIALL